MNRVKKLKRDLGSEYAYQRFMSDREVSRLRRQAPVQFEDTIAASLTVGCMKINAVLFQEDGTLRLGYDVYVKDSPGSSEWICFDCPNDRASLKEQDKVIKNAIIQAAMDLVLDSQQEQGEAEDDTDNKHKPLSTVGTANIGMNALRLLQQTSQILQNEVRPVYQDKRVDRKLRRKINEKKQAQGLRQGENYV